MGVKKPLKHTRAPKKHSGSPVKQKFDRNAGINVNNVNKKPKQKKTMVIAQEIKFARVLASNDKKARAKMLKNLRAWITVRSQSSFGNYYYYYKYLFVNCLNLAGEKVGFDYLKKMDFPRLL